MTQKERLKLLVSLCNSFDLEAVSNSLELLVSDSQNAPPEGGSDNTIGEREWILARNLHFSLTDAVHNIQTLRALLSK